jgi:hypothetical protein
MSDGTKTYKGLTLQTQYFTVKEVVYIISILIYKFDLSCSSHMQRNQPTIYISYNSFYEQITITYFTIFFLIL